LPVEFFIKAVNLGGVHNEMSILHAIPEGAFERMKFNFQNSIQFLSIPLLQGTEIPNPFRNPARDASELARDDPYFRGNSDIRIS